MNNVIKVVLLVVVVLVAVVAAQAFYTVNETERVIVTQFGANVSTALPVASSGALPGR